MADGRFAARADTDVRVGQILSRAASIWPRVLMPYFFIYGVAALPSAIQQYQQRAQHITSPQEIYTAAGITVLIAMAIGVFARAGTASITIDVIQDGTPRAGSSLGVAAWAFPRLLLATLCSILAFALASVLLFFPVLILYTMWLVATPCCVLEGLGPIACLNRSANLTKGYRWRLFGLMLVLGVIGIIVAVVGLGAVRFAGPVAGACVQLVAGGLSSTYFEVAAVVTYAALRAAKEGSSATRLANVF
jgi:ABC-type multidrug transport system fused ATPase/permease subunit